MIIDCHGHYTTAPKGLQAFRDSQLAGLKDPKHVPSKGTLKITDDEITFKVIRDRDGRKVTAKYKGKITGDTVKGKVESDWSGDWQTLDWEGTRGK